MMGGAYLSANRVHNGSRKANRGKKKEVLLIVNHINFNPMAKEQNLDIVMTKS